MLMMMMSDNLGGILYEIESEDYVLEIYLIIVQQKENSITVNTKIRLEFSLSLDLVTELKLVFMSPPFFSFFLFQNAQQTLHRHAYKYAAFFGLVADEEIRARKFGSSDIYMVERERRGGTGKVSLFCASVQSVSVCVHHLFAFFSTYCFHSYLFVPCFLFPFLCSFPLSFFYCWH